MAIFKRNEHIEVAVAKPSLAEAVQSAKDAMQQAETALVNHDNEAARLIRAREEATSALDSATMAGEERQIESLVRVHFDFQQRIESLARVRSHRAAQVESARQAKHTAERAAADEQQQTLIAQKKTLNRQIIEAVEGLGNLIATAERAQTDIDTLAQRWDLSRPRARWLIPSGFILSKGGEALRVALDLKMAYGATMDLSLITSDDAALDAVIAEQVAEEEILAALAEEMAHV
jgi:hypothetical protein